MRMYVFIAWCLGAGVTSYIPAFPKWGVNRRSLKKSRNQKIVDFLLNLNLAYFDHSSRFCSYKNFIRTFYLVANRSRCTGFDLINEGPQNTCVP
jgi:hypothetical protein